MNDVILELDFALQLQENVEQCKNAGIVTLPSELMKKEEISDKQFKEIYNLRKEELLKIQNVTIVQGVHF